MPELTNEDIAKLYSNVLQNDKCERLWNFRKQFHNAVRAMAEAYKPNGRSFADPDDYLKPNYNGQMFRYAYLFKYGAFHTALVQEMVQKILQRSSNAVQNELDIKSNGFKVCCLGGGPGTDLLGLLSTLIESLGLFNCTAVIVDEKKWQKTFDSLLTELRRGGYGRLSKFVKGNFEWKYLNADLLDELGNEVTAAIRSSDLITMVKFLSAAMCCRAVHMVESIFKSMEPGSILLFIDNAAGGFHELMSNIASRCGMTEICKPLRHEHYYNLELLRSIFNINSCFQTRITIQLWRKGSKRILPPKRKPLTKNKLNSTQSFKQQTEQIAQSKSGIPFCSNSNLIIPLSPKAESTTANFAEENLNPTQNFKTQAEQIIQSKTGIPSCFNSNRIILPSPASESTATTFEDNKLKPTQSFKTQTEQIIQSRAGIPSCFNSNRIVQPFPAAESTATTNSENKLNPTQSLKSQTKQIIQSRRGNPSCLNISCITSSSPTKEFAKVISTAATMAENKFNPSQSLKPQTEQIIKSRTVIPHHFNSNIIPTSLSTESITSTPLTCDRQTPQTKTFSSSERSNIFVNLPVFPAPTIYQLSQQINIIPTYQTATSPSTESTSRPLFFERQTPQNIQPRKKSLSSSATSSSANILHSFPISKKPSTLRPKDSTYTVSTDKTSALKTTKNFGTFSDEFLTPVVTKPPPSPSVLQNAVVSTNPKHDGLITTYGHPGEQNTNNTLSNGHNNDNDVLIVPSTEHENNSCCNSCVIS